MLTVLPRISRVAIMLAEKIDTFLMAEEDYRISRHAGLLPADISLASCPYDGAKLWLSAVADNLSPLSCHWTLGWCSMCFSEFLVWWNIWTIK